MFLPERTGEWGVKGNMTLIWKSLHDFPQGWIRTNYDDRAETNADTLSSILSPAYSTLSDRIKTPNPILCHSWLKTKGHCSNKFLNSFHGDWILFFLPCCFGIAIGFCWWASFYKSPWKKEFFKVKELVCCVGERWASGWSFLTFSLGASLYSGCFKIYHPCHHLPHEH